MSVLLNPGAAQVQFNSPTYTVSESAGTATITVTRTGDTSGAVSVRYTTSNGTAAAGPPRASSRRIRRQSHSRSAR